MGGGPALIDLGHPVVGLVERVVGVATARPVAQRHRGGHAALAGMDLAAYSELSRLRSSTSAWMSACSGFSRAIPSSRKVLDISPGQVPSLRADPQISSTRDGLAGSAQRSCAASMRCFVSAHSDDKS